MSVKVEVEVSSVMIIEDNIPEQIWSFDSKEKAEKFFIDTIRESKEDYDLDFDESNTDDILNDGSYRLCEDRYICLVHSSLRKS
jgi:hypothetical protein